MAELGTRLLLHLGMQPAVITVRNQLQVIDVIILTIAIDVVHVFVWIQQPAQMFFHGKAMFANVAAGLG